MKTLEEIVLRTERETSASEGKIGESRRLIRAALAEIRPKDLMCPYGDKRRHLRDAWLLGLNTLDLNATEFLK